MRKGSYFGDEIMSERGGAQWSKLTVALLLDLHGGSCQLAAEARETHSSLQLPFNYTCSSSFYVWPFRLILSGIAAPTRLWAEGKTSLCRISHHDLPVARRWHRSPQVERLYANSTTTLSALYLLFKICSLHPRTLSRCPHP